MSYKIDTLKNVLSKNIKLSNREEKAFAVFNVFMTASVDGLQLQELNMRQQLITCAFAAGALDGAWELFEVAQDEESYEAQRVLELLVRYLSNVLRFNEACVTAFIEGADEFLRSEGGSSIANAGKNCLNAHLIIMESVRASLSESEANDLVAFARAAAPFNSQLRDMTNALREMISSK